MVFSSPFSKGIGRTMVTVNVVILCMYMILLSCAGNRENYNSEKTWPPDWFIKPPERTGYVFVSAMGTSPKPKDAFNNAMANARVSLASIVKTKFGTFSSHYVRDNSDTADAQPNDSYVRYGTQVLTGVLRHVEIAFQDYRYNSELKSIEYAVLLYIPESIISEQIEKLKNHLE